MEGKTSSLPLFEGPEKKVELVLRKGAKALRSYGEEAWKKVIECAKTKALSKISNELFCAYLLSESSLFVFDDKVIMITCGRTNLVAGLFAMLDFIDKDDIDLLIYERKNHNFPSLQPTDFSDDVTCLNKAFPGTALCFGDLNGEHIALFHINKKYSPQAEDHTLELLFNDIDEQARDLFCSGPTHSLDTIRETGIREILPGFEIDEYLFEPMGYSMNAIKGDEYYTIHVTPQEVGSFVSFETNHTFKDDLSETITRVTNIFRPASFNLLFFCNDKGLSLPPQDGFDCAIDLRGRLSCGYEVQFCHYQKES